MALKTGLIDLGVPIKDGAIQIGADDLAMQSRLMVHSDEKSIHIYRPDGDPIQVEMDRVNYFDDRLAIERISLFTDPVESVAIHREMGGIAWQLLKNVDMLTDEKSFWKFMSHTIGYADLKQKRHQ